jgi:hypothetical protein
VHSLGDEAQVPHSTPLRCVDHLHDIGLPRLRYASFGGDGENGIPSYRCPKKKAAVANHGGLMSSSDS